MANSAAIAKRRERVGQLASLGKSNGEIARALAEEFDSVSRETIGIDRKTLGLPSLPRGSRPLDPRHRRARTDEAAALVDKGWTYEQIAKEQGRSKSQVSKDLNWLRKERWLEGSRRAELVERAAGLRVQRDLTGREIADELSAYIGFKLSTTTAYRLLDEGCAQPRRRSGTARYEPPEERPCDWCRKPFTPKFPSHAVNGRGKYHSGECSDLAHGHQLHERWQRLRAALESVKGEACYDTGEVADLLGVTENVVSAFYVARGYLAAERHEIENQVFLLYTATEVERFRRKWVLNLYNDGRRANWLKPDHVVKMYEARGLVTTGAERKGLTEKQEKLLIRAGVDDRRRALLPHRAGRKPSSAPPTYHVEWRDEWLRQMATLKDEYGTRAELALLAEGERPPRNFHAALAVAEADFSAHPERWRDYPHAPGDPMSLHPDYGQSAADRTWKSIKKLLQNPQNEITDT